MSASFSRSSRGMSLRTESRLEPKCMLIGRKHDRKLVNKAADAAADAEGLVSKAADAAADAEGPHDDDDDDDAADDDDEEEEEKEKEDEDDEDDEEDNTLR